MIIMPNESFIKFKTLQLRKKFSNTIKFLIFFFAGIFLFWMAYRGQSASELWHVLKNDVNYWWILLSLFCGLLSHISRALRWNLLIESLGKKPKIGNTFLAVMVGYFANLALPRMGEISRCGIMKKYEKISFSQLIGTVVLERMFDVIMLLICLLIAFLTQFSVILKFFTNNPEIGINLSKIFSSFYTILVLLAGFITAFFLHKKFKNSLFLERVKQIFMHFATGFKSIKKIKHKWIFVLHTVFIWLMYYLMTYVCFFGFEFTSNLSALAGLTVFVMSAFGMVAPVQGGIGAWHFMVIGTLLVYLPQVSEIEIMSRSFALVVHGSQTAMIIILGTLSVIALPFFNLKNK